MALRQQQKSIALTHLRFRKGLEDVLTKRLGALQNLESTLMTVETAAGDIEVGPHLILGTLFIAPRS